MNKYQALQYFWSLFGWKAYNELTVPSDAMEQNNNRYITYESATDSSGESLLLSGSLWMRSTSWTEIHAKAEEIATYIQTHFPPHIVIDDGCLVIKKAQPFASDARDDDLTIRRVRLNIYAEFITNS